MPETKPDLHIDEQGVCSACRAYEMRGTVDWGKRQIELESVLQRYRLENAKNWDCIVPVSGGKDSHYQVLKMLEMGMNPLCVNAGVWEFTALGRRNLDNIKQLGVDVLEFSVNQSVRAKISKIGLTQVGDISWPEHVGIFTIPVRVAVNFSIPLIVWGENSQNEYGGPASSVDNHILDRAWLEEFGGLLGMRVSDLEEVGGIPHNDLLPYRYPDDSDLHSVGVTGLFLGHYLPWDGVSNTLISHAYGFESYPTSVEGSFVNYENLDNHYVGIHDYFKFLKFGFGRVTDQVCLHIRRGRLTRNEGLEIVKKLDGKFPWSYLGKPLENALADIDTTLEEFFEICDRFTNKHLFVKDSNGQLEKDSKHNLTLCSWDAGEM